MNITVYEELRAYIDPLTPEEHDALERSILAEGCRDALVLWGEVLVDGHNRYGICQKHGLPFNTVQNTRFKSMEDVHLWMIDQHLGRRSVSDFQRGVLALRKKEILSARQPAVVADGALGDSATTPGGVDAVSGQAPWDGAMDPAVAAAAATLPPPEPLTSREAIAKAARISSTTVSQIEKIQKAAAPELVEAVKAGVISINAAAAVASLPVEEQVAAVAGGKKELQQAARQVREAKSRTRAPAVDEANADGVDAASESNESPDQVIARLKQTVAELQAENAQLKAQLAALA
ncbi:MAG: plasmid replication/partition related protein [Burkholderiales bacterium]|nr:plasmid replication/partition related protein [Burkholderiales bacterium]